MQRFLSKLTGRWQSVRGLQQSVKRQRLRRLLVEQLEDRKLLSATHPLPLSSLDGINGFRIDGFKKNAHSGRSVSSGGDVNGDGFDDLIIGAEFADPNGSSNQGESYLVFGKSDGFGSAIALSSLNGTNGFRIDGIDAYDRSGVSLSSAGDVNGDGFDDLIVGADGAAPNGISSAGESYVIFGKSGWFGSAIALSSLDGTNGFRIDGIEAGDRSGFSVSSAGDVNGDGFDDLIVGAMFAYRGAMSRVGESYVIFGRADGFGSAIALNNLNGINGFRIEGVDAFDYSGRSVSSGGDVNGDGFDDLIVGADEADPRGNSAAGESYVIFGKSSGFLSAIRLSSLNGITGFRIDGIDVNDFSGSSVSSGGDVNGDGFDDLIVGAVGADSVAGESYVIFGKSVGFFSAIALSSLNSSDGFRIDGIDAYDRSGNSVSSGGDVNGDGFDDLIVGAHTADPGGISGAGESYVIFGKSFGFGSAIALSSLDGGNGFRIDGIDVDDFSGFSVSSGGDVNGDGFDDLIVGAGTGDPDGIFSAGESYVIFGGNFTGGIETQVGLDGDDTKSANQGFSAVDILIGGRGNDTLISDGGSDVLIGGQGNDVLAIPDVNFSGRRRLLGGNGTDTLRLDGSGLTLDLTTVRDNRMVDIERIDLGSGKNHVLKLNAREVRNLSSHSNTLTIVGGGSQVRFLDGVWTGPTPVNISGTDYRQYTLGSATVNIQTTLTDRIEAISLANLNGTTGFRLDGVDALNWSGWSVSSAGDVNGDGFDDLIVGAYLADPNNIVYSGSSYVVFGNSGGFANSINLSTLDGTNGFRLDGVAAGDYSGSTVSSAGDVNGDGFDDLIVGAHRADPNGEDRAGSSYVVFGKSGLFDATIDLVDLDGTNGFRLDGVAALDNSGFSVSSAGDVNGDGFDDLIVGAHKADPNGADHAGSSYVVFGMSGGFATSINLSTLGGTNGFRLDGVADLDESGRSVSSAGDVNGDGFDDLIVGAIGADPNGSFSGSSYVVFGKSDWTSTPTINLSTLNGTTGFRLDGVAAFDALSGASVSSAGDVNGDGFDDLIVGATGADHNSSSSGSSYVVFGKSAWSLTPTINLSTLDGTNGFRLDGVAAFDYSGVSVSSAGDFNGDGFDDLMVGADGADHNGSFSGSSYVVFGKSDWSLTPTINLSTLNGTNGFRLDGEAADDWSGWSVSSAGDVNGDGFDDLMVGAPNANSNGTNTGSSYVVFGGNHFTSSISPANLGDSSANSISGNSGADILNGAGGDDTLSGDGGADILLGGQGNDTLAVSDLSFNRIVGGNGTDSLQLDGSSLTLDLTTIRDNRILDIEQIDLGSGQNNFLKLTAREVRNLSSHSNTLTVLGDGSQVHIFGTGWSPWSTVLIANVPFRQTTNGSAVLLVQPDLVVGFPVLALSSLDGTSGFRLEGIDVGDEAGRSVSSAGDINGDGYDDLIIGAPGSFNSAPGTTGESYVVFGKSGGFDAAIPLSSLNGINGFRLGGIDAGDRAGNSVAAAGDVNGDGLADLIISADAANGNVGESYVMFGKTGSFDALIPLSSLSGSTGFRIDGLPLGLNSGRSVSGAGDVNGDGYDDLIIGASSTDRHVVFGKSSSFGASLSLSGLNGSNGFQLENATGGTVSSAGDFNGDGFGDLIIGSPFDEVSNQYARGISYVVFGKPNGFSAVINFNSLDGSNGFRLLGASEYDYAGTSVSRAGDINGDGFDDLIVGAPKTDPGNIDAGTTYVVFGKSGSFSPNFNMSGNLDGSNGFRLEGAGASHYSGRAVSAAGDFNGDGFDDLIVGSVGTSTNGNAFAGGSYVVFGKSSNFSAVINLSSLNGSNGLRIDGIDSGDFSGTSVSGAGDVNGDGFDDLIIGAHGADPSSFDSAGESYVVFGGNLFTASILPENLGNSGAQTINGTAIAEILNGSGGDDLLVGNGGADVLMGGQGDDVLAVSDLTFKRIVGGSGIDTLRLDGSGLHLNLSTIPDNRILDIEQIDITGSGNNTLTLTAREVLNLSSHSNALVVRINLGDTVNIGSGWTQQADELIGGVTYVVFTQGAATLKIQPVALPTAIVGSYVYHFGSSFDQPNQLQNALDTGKVLAKEGPSTQTLGFNNLINTTRGINGLVFDIQNLAGTVTASDFVFQMSPTGAFNEGSNPVSGWQLAPSPSAITNLGGSPSRIALTWAPNSAVTNRWLRVTVKATANTGLSVPEVYYIGHLLGETTGPSGGRFTVLVADILKVRAELSHSANASSIEDLDKSGTVLVADILASRSNLTQELRQITIPAAGGGGGGGGSLMDNQELAVNFDSSIELSTALNTQLLYGAAYAAAVDSALDDFYSTNQRRRGRRS